VGFWAVAATVLGRALAPALPGTSAGIGALIATVNQLSAFATQFAVVMGVAACLRLLLSNVRTRRAAYRPLAIVCCAASLPLVISASSHELEPTWLAALVGFSGLLGLVSVYPASLPRHSRAAGLVVLLVTLGSLISAGARLLALDASDGAQAALFRLARGIATLGVGFDAVATAVAAIWLSRRLRHGRAVVGALFAVAVALVWMGTTGDVDVHPLRALVARALESLMSHPDPFVGSWFRYLAEVAALLVAAVALWVRRPEGVGPALSFALLSRVSGDVPACALMLMLAALAAVRASLISSGSAPADARRPSDPRASLEVVPATR
jgi:hypothetical protein